MNRAATILYFALPGAVVVLPVVRNSDAALGSGIAVSDLLIAGVMNYLFFALPQICWFGIAPFVQAPSVAKHAGYLGATIPLAGLAIAFDCCIWNENALGWFYYWPMAVAGMIGSLVIVLLCGLWNRSEA